MVLDPRKPFPENVASGLQGLTWLATVFLYFLGALVLVPLSMLFTRVSGQKPSPYLIPLLVVLLIGVEYLYCWRLVFQKRGPARPLLGVGMLSAIVYSFYRVPADFMDRSWPHFEVLRRSLSWLFGGTVVRSILGPLALLAGYGVFHRFLIRKRWFIVVSEFRVWGDLAEKFSEEGVASRLKDELMRLWIEMRRPDLQKLLEDASHGPGAIPERDFADATEGLALYDAEGFTLPETPVTLQYRGISIEGMNTFFRRIAKREVVISGDLINHAHGIVLIARTQDYGPWEVRVTGSNSAALEAGLQRLALRIMTKLTEKFQPKAANAFVMLQIKARALGEYFQALRLAELGLRAAPDQQKAKGNLATAHNDIGSAFGKKQEYAAAILEFKEAIKLDPVFVEAWENLAHAHKLVGQKREAAAASEQADRIRP